MPCSAWTKPGLQPYPSASLAVVAWLFLPRTRYVHSYINLQPRQVHSPHLMKIGQLSSVQLFDSTWLREESTVYVTSPDCLYTNLGKRYIYIYKLISTQIWGKFIYLKIDENARAEITLSSSKIERPSNSWSFLLLSWWLTQKIKILLLYKWPSNKKFLA